jgi:phage terminase large subunit GpA-like protein
MKIFTVGTDTAKELIYSRLQIEEFGNGYMHFNKSFDEEYFKQLTAEKIQTQYHKGHQKRVWVKTRPRNESLDCTVYNLAALSILNPNFKALKTNIHKPEAPKKKPKKRRNLGNYMEEF